MIGYIGRINDTEVTQLEDEDLAANYRGSDYIGKTGLEQSYESDLHGTTGIEQVEVDANGRAVRGISRTAPVPGNTLVLSIDIKLQEIAEQSFGIYRGALVAIDPNNGEVLAFVSKPGYDPNLFIDGIDPQSWDELNNSPDVPLTNRALRGQYPSGSTIKPFMALAGLYYHTRTPEQTINDPGVYYLPGSSRQLSRLEGGRPRQREHVQGHTDVLRYLFLRSGNRYGHRQHLQLSVALWFWQEDWYRSGG